jgi:hypothetical protein
MPPLYTRGVSEAEHASEPSGVAGSLLAELEAGGQLIDTGSFTIDSQQARAKLREYLLADPHAYVLLLVEAAVLGGANPVCIDTDGGHIRIDLGPISLAASELEQLFAAVFRDPSAAEGPERNRRRALQKLAYACNAALRLEPRMIEIFADDGQGSAHHLRLTPADDRGQLERIGPVVGVQVRIAQSGLTDLSVAEPRERELIRRHCAFSSVPIQLDGKRISKGMEFALHVELSPDDLSFSPRARKVTAVELDGHRIGSAGMRYSGKRPAEVTILTNGVLAERFVLGDAERPAAPDFGAVVDVDLGKDLGQNKLLRGPEYDRVMAAIWAVHDRIAPADFDAPLTSHAPVVGGGFEQFRLPAALIVIGVLLAAWGLNDNGGQGELLSVFAIATASVGIVGVVLGVLRSLKR